MPTSETSLNSINHVIELKGYLVLITWQKKNCFLRLASIIIKTEKMFKKEDTSSRFKNKCISNCPNYDSKNTFKNYDPWELPRRHRHIAFED